MIDLKPAVERFVERFKKREAEKEAKLAPLRPIRCISFNTSEWESVAISEWFAEHRKVCVHNNYKLAQEKGVPTAAIGGALTYQFTPTSLGVAVSVKCACGEKADVTDYDSW